MDSFTAIIFPPHAAILAVGAVKEQPVVRDGQLSIAEMMKATLSVDHRVADGAEAAQFLMEIKRTAGKSLSACCCRPLGSIVQQTMPPEE